MRRAALRRSLLVRRPAAVGRAPADARGVALAGPLTDDPDLLAAIADLVSSTI